MYSYSSLVLAIATRAKNKSKTGKKKFSFFVTLKYDLFTINTPKGINMNIKYFLALYI